MLHASERAEAGARTDFAKPFLHFQQHLKRHGLVAVISDYYEDPETVIKTMRPIQYRGNEVILFHVLDAREIAPDFREPALVVDLESRESLEVSPEYARSAYRSKIDAHIEALRAKALSADMDYVLMNTARPLDEGLCEYLTVRQGRM